MADNKDWDYTLLYEETNRETKKFIELYEKNPHHARVVFLNGQYYRYSHQRVCLYDNPDNDDFDIVLYRVSYGVSVTNKKYRHSKRLMTLRYREKNGFWFCIGRQIRRPNDLVNDFSLGNPMVVKKVLMEKFAWYQCMVENAIHFDKQLTVHKVWNKKLFNLNKLLKAYYNVPIAPAKLLHKKYGLLGQNSQVVGLIRSNGKFLKNIENLRAEYLEAGDGNENIFKDSLIMAKKLGKIVNCSWGIKRLKKEHDDWSEEITNILFVEDNQALNIKGVFYEFAMFSEYYMIKTTRGLALEGQRQKHCVGGYAGAVNGGRCAIFHIKGFTLELRIEDVHKPVLGGIRFTLINNQFRGYVNGAAPEELTQEVNDKIEEFNKRFEEHDCLKNGWYTYDGDESNRLVHISEGAHEYEIFNLDVLDDDGEPEQILIDETIVDGEMIVNDLDDWVDDLPF